MNSLAPSAAEEETTPLNRVGTGSGRRRRVALVIRSAGTGGLESHVCSLVRNLRARGEEPVVVSLAGEPPHQQFRALGCPVIVLSDRGSWSWRTVLAGLALWRELRRIRPDVVHVHGARPILIGTLAARAAGCRAVVASLHGSYALMAMAADGTTPPAMEWMARVVHGIGFLLASRIVVCADRLRGDVTRSVRGVIGCMPAWVARRIRVVYHGIDAAQFTSPQPDRIDAQSDRDAPLTVGTLSRLDEPKKGIGILLEAIAEAGRRVPIRLLVAGDGHSRRELEARAAALALTDCRFLGYVEDVAAFYRSLDVFVLASLSEGMPLVNLEAMASGVPVITTDVGGAAEAVEDGRSGLVVPPGSAAALAAAIASLAADPDQARRLAEAGRTRVREHFTIDVTCERVCAVYDEVAAETRSRTA